MTKKLFPYILIATLILASLSGCMFLKNEGGINGNVELVSPLGESDYSNVLIKIKGTNITVKTDKSGYFIIKNLKSGKYILQISKDKYDSKEVEVEVEAGAITPVSVKLFYKYGAVNISIQSDGANGTAKLELIELSSTKTVYSELIKVPTTKLIPDLNPGDYILKITSDTYETYQINLSINKSTLRNLGTIILQSLLGDIIGIVKPTDNSQPSNFSVKLFDKSDKMIYEGKTNTTGKFYINGVKEGEYRLEITKKNYITASLDVTVTRNKVTDLGEINIQPGEEGKGLLQGRVILEDKPADENQGITVSAKLDGKTAQTTVTDKLGNYKMLLPAGNYTIEYSMQNYTSESTQVKILEGRIVNIDLIKLLRKKGNLSGRVVLLGSADNAGAKLNLADKWYTETDSSGRFTFTNIPVGRYTLKISADKYHTQSFEVDITAGSTATKEATLEPYTGEIEGFAKYEGATTHGGISVTVEGTTLDLNGNDKSFSKTVSTDAKGYYHITGVPFGNYKLRFSAEGYKEESIDIVLGVGEKKTVQEVVTLEAVKTKGIIQGRVVLEDKPAFENGGITVTVKEATKLVDSRVTASYGNYIFVVKGGNYTIEYIKDGYTRESTEITVENGKTTNIDTIVLKRKTSTLKGKISLLGSENNSGAIVTIENIEMSQDRSRGKGDIKLPIKGREIGKIEGIRLPEAEVTSIYSTKTDIKGNYEFENIPIGIYRIKIEADRYKAKTDEINITSNGVTYNATLEPYTGEIEGFAKYEGATTHGGISVTVEGTTLDLNGNDKSFSKTVSTDAKGYYHITGVPFGNYKLRFSAEGYKEESIDIVLGVGEKKTVQEVVTLEAVKTKGIIQGRVVLEDKPAFSNEGITVALKSASDNSLKDTKVTDSYGNYSFITSPGDYYVEFSKESYESTKTSVKVEAGETVNLKAIVLKRKTLPVEGTVVLLGNDTNMGAIVNIGGIREVTDREGKYSMIVPTGIADIKITAENYKPYEKRITIEGESTLTINATLEPLKGVIEGFSRYASSTNDDDSGIAVTLEGTTLSYPDGKKVPYTDTTSTDKNGHYGFANVPPGWYILRFTSDGYVSVTIENIHLYPNQKLTIPQIVTMETRPRFGSLYGKAYLSDSSDHSGIAVLAKRAGGEGFTTTTDKDGNFVFPQLPPGDYFLEFSKFPYKTVRIENIKIEVGKKLHLQNAVILERKKGKITGVIKLEGKSSNEGIAVQVLGDYVKQTGTVITGYTDAEGRVEIEAPVGVNYTGFRIFKDEDFEEKIIKDNFQTSESGAYKINSGDPIILRALKNTIKGRAMISGYSDHRNIIVELYPKNPTNDASIVFATTYTDPQGYYTFNHVPLGGYIIKASFTNCGYVLQSVEVKPGDYIKPPDIVLVPNAGGVTGYVHLNGMSDSSGITVRLVSTESQNSQSYTARTDSSGHYEFGSVLEGTYTIYAEKAGWDSASITNIKVIADKITTVDDMTLYDRTPPQIKKVLINGGAAMTDNNRVIVTVQAFDEGSGISEVMIWEDGQSGSWQNYEFQKIFDLSQATGTHTVHVKVKDRSGNVSNETTASIEVIELPPWTLLTNYLHGKVVYGDAIITVAQSPYYVDEGILILGNLEIEPGVVLIFKEGKPINVKGRVIALGTAQKPIIMKPENEGGSFSFKVLRPDGTQYSTSKFSKTGEYIQKILRKPVKVPKISTRSIKEQILADIQRTRELIETRNFTKEDLEEVNIDISKFKDTRMKLMDTDSQNEGSVQMEHVQIQGTFQSELPVTASDSYFKSISAAANLENCSVGTFSGSGSFKNGSAQSISGNISVENAQVTGNLNVNGAYVKNTTISESITTSDAYVNDVKASGGSFTNSVIENSEFTNGVSLNGSKITESQITGGSVNISSSIVIGNIITGTNGIYVSSGWSYIIYNDITNNGDVGIRINTNDIKINYNNIYGHTQYDIKLESGAKGREIDAKYNFFYTSNPELIKDKIYDFEDDDNHELSRVIFDPFITEDISVDNEYVPIGSSTPLTGEIYMPIKLTKENSPYRVSGDLIIYTGIYIEPGVEIIFDEDSKMTVKYGTFIASGTEDEPIVMHGDNGADWKGLFLISTHSYINGLSANYLNVSGNVRTFRISYSTLGKLFLRSTEMIIENSIVKNIDFLGDLYLIENSNIGHLTGDVYKEGNIVNSNVDFVLLNYPVTYSLINSHFREVATVSMGNTINKLVLKGCTIEDLKYTVSLEVKELVIEDSTIFRLVNDYPGEDDYGIYGGSVKILNSSFNSKIIIHSNSVISHSKFNDTVILANQSQITYNTFSDIDGDGLIIHSSVSDFSNNTFYGITGYAVVVKSGALANFTKNFIALNGGGIKIENFTGEKLEIKDNVIMLNREYNILNQTDKEVIANDNFWALYTKDSIEDTLSGSVTVNTFKTSMIEDAGSDEKPDIGDVLSFTNLSDYINEGNTTLDEASSPYLVTKDMELDNIEISGDVEIRIVDGISLTLKDPDQTSGKLTIRALYDRDYPSDLTKLVLDGSLSDVKVYGVTLDGGNIDNIELENGALNSASVSSLTVSGTSSIEDSYISSADIDGNVKIKGSAVKAADVKGNAQFENTNVSTSTFDGADAKFTGSTIEDSEFTDSSVEMENSYVKTSHFDNSPLVIKDTKIFFSKFENADVAITVDGMSDEDAVYIMKNHFKGNTTDIKSNVSITVNAQYNYFEDGANVEGNVDISNELAEPPSTEPVALGHTITGKIILDSVLKTSDEDYKIQGDLIIIGKLTVEPGVVLKIEEGKRIIVKGILEFDGEDGNIIKLQPDTSILIKDKWGGITVENGGKLIMNYVETGYASTLINAKCGSYVEINDSKIKLNTVAFDVHQGASLKISSSRITSNTNVFSKNYGIAEVDNTSMSGNSKILNDDDGSGGFTLILKNSDIQNSGDSSFYLVAIESYDSTITSLTGTKKIYALNSYIGSINYASWGAVYNIENSVVNYADIYDGDVQMSLKESTVNNIYISHGESMMRGENTYFKKLNLYSAENFDVENSTIVYLNINGPNINEFSVSNSWIRNINITTSVTLIFQNIMLDGSISTAGVDSCCISTDRAISVSGGGMIGLVNATIRGYNYGIYIDNGAIVQLDKVKIVNNNYGIYINQLLSPDVEQSFSGNWLDNTQYNIYNNTSNTVTADGNYWGTTDINEVKSKLHNVQVETILNEPPEGAGFTQ